MNGRPQTGDSEDDQILHEGIGVRKRLHERHVLVPTKRESMRHRSNDEL